MQPQNCSEFFIGVLVDEANIWTEPVLVLQVGELGRLVRMAKSGVQKWSTRGAESIKNCQRGVQN